MPSLVETGPIVLKRGFLNIFNIIFTVSLLPPLWEGGVLQLNKLESPPLKDVLYQVWLKLT